MTVLSGQTIARRGIISPFHERTQHLGMTYGIGPAGYDVRVEFDENGLERKFVIFGHSMRLASTIEHFLMPPDVIGFVCDKSSWARKGLTVQNTVIEPGWSGWLTLELVNHTDYPIELNRGMPIAQVVFHYLDEPAVLAYSGKYQNQRRGPQEAK